MLQCIEPPPVSRIMIELLHAMSMILSLKSNSHLTRWLQVAVDSVFVKRRNKTRGIYVYKCFLLCRILKNYMEGDGKIKTEDVMKHYMNSFAEEETHIMVSV